MKIPQKNLVDIIKNQLIEPGELQQIPILAMPYHSPELPRGVVMANKKILGLRVPVKNRRPASQMSAITARWPEDGLCSRNDALLYFVTSGHMKLHIGQQLLNCQAGTCIFVPPGLPHPAGDFAESMDGFASFLSARRCGRGMRFWQSHLREGRIRYARPGESFYISDETTLNAFGILCRELENDNDPNIVQHSLVLFFRLLYRNLKTENAYSVAAYVPDREIEYWENDKPYSPIEVACQYIQSHLADPITVEGVARVVHMSRANFALIFKREMKQTFLEYVQNMRIERAKQFLDNTDWTVQTVSSLCGFSSYPAFNNFFKQKVGTTPNKYRQRQR